MANAVKEITDADFESTVLKSALPVVVDFWAPWCGPCKSIAPILDEVATAYEGKLTVVKINVDDNHRAAGNYKVRSIPNLLFFKGGAVVEQLVGFQQKDQIVQVIDRVLA